MATTALPIRKALAANSTASSFTAKIPTVTAPSGAGIFDLTDPQYGMGVNGRVPDRILVVPFGGNSNDETFDMRVWGWSRTVGADGTAIWLPQLLAQLSIILGNIDGTAIAANMLIADTITVTYGLADERTLGLSVMSPSNDVPAAAYIGVRGCERIEFDFDLTGTGDAANCFWRGVTTLN